MLNHSARNPFQFMIVTAFTLYCLIGLMFFEQVATTTIRAFPVPFGMVFLFFAALTGIVVLAGLVLAGRPEGVLIERAGLIGLSGLTLMYGVWALEFTKARGIGFGFMMLAIAISGTWRVIQISRANRAARRIVDGE